MDRRFTTDGCSGGLSKAWRLLTGHGPPFGECCCAHDHAYWRGGSNTERADADTALRICVAGQGYFMWAWVIWVAVRLFGGSHFLFSGRHKWGWGIMTNIDRLLHEAPHVDPIGLAVLHGEEATLEASRGRGDKKTREVHRTGSAGGSRYDLS